MIKHHLGFQLFYMIKHHLGFQLFYMIKHHLGFQLSVLWIIVIKASVFSSVHNNYNRLHCTENLKK